MTESSGHCPCCWLNQLGRRLTASCPRTCSTGQSRCSWLQQTAWRPAACRGPIPCSCSWSPAPRACATACWPTWSWTSGASAGGAGLAAASGDECLIHAVTLCPPVLLAEAKHACSAASSSLQPICTARHLAHAHLPAAQPGGDSLGPALTGAEGSCSCFVTLGQQLLALPRCSGGHWQNACIASVQRLHTCIS